MFSEILQGMSFKINPYDPCVAYKEVNGTQFTIIWYADDTKISHKDHKVLRDLITALENKFGEMSKSFGAEHMFLSIN